MIKTIFRNPFSFGLLASSLTIFLALIASLMATIIVLFCFPVIGEAVANWVGHSRIALLIQLLY